MPLPSSLFRFRICSRGCIRALRWGWPLLQLGLGLVVTPVLAPRPLGAQTAAAQPSTRAVRVQIETDRASYRAGDSIVVRLTLTNIGGVPLELSRVPPWRAAQLIVTGADGQPVALTHPIDGRFFRSTRSFTLEPGGSLVESFGSQRWTALQSFGYGPLTPGQYTLTAVPLVQGPDVDVDAETVRSNQVIITIAP